MGRAAPLTLIALCLAGCGQSGLERAEADYNFRKRNHAERDDLCLAAKRVAEEAAKARDSSAYTLWNIQSHNDCEPPLLQ